jgi:hypothetical protein
MEITYTQLRLAGACQEQRDLFRELFGDKVTLTKELCVKHAADFDWGWVVDILMTDEQSEKYYEIITPADTAYSAASRHARNIYENVKLTHFPGSIALQEAWNTYNDACVAAGVAYDIANAGIVADVLLGD